METKKLIEWLEEGKKERQARAVKFGGTTYEVDIWWDNDERILREIIKRLGELEDLKEALSIARELQRKVAR